MSPTKRAFVSLLSGAVIISFAPVLVRAMETPPTTAAFWRCFIGGSVLVGVAALEPNRRMPGRRALLFGALAGFFFALDLTAWHRSIHLIGPGLSTLLVNFQVFVLALFGVLFFGEQVRARLLIAIPLAIAGLALIVGVSATPLSDEVQQGVLLGLCTALVYAGYILSLRRARSEETTPVLEVGIASLAAAVVLLPLTLAFGEPLAIASPREGSLLLAYALVPQVIGWVLISRSLPVVPASLVGLLLLLQPTLAFVWDILLFARPFSLREGLGATLTLVAVGIGAFAGPSRPAFWRARPTDAPKA